MRSNGGRHSPQPANANAHQGRHRAAARVIHCPYGLKKRADLAAAASLGVVQAVNQD